MGVGGGLPVSVVGSEVDHICEEMTQPSVSSVTGSRSSADTGMAVSRRSLEK